MSEGLSLLSFLDAPLLVGDPDGCVIYVNPAFERHFGVVASQARGEELAAMFSGGGREAVLGAVAQVCGGQGTQRFRLREDGRGYLVIASPIQAQADHVGVIILLTDEPLADERLLAFHREVEEPLEEILGCLEELIDEGSGRGSERFRSAVEKAIAAIGRASKWSDGLRSLLTGVRESAPSASELDPVIVVRQSVARTRKEFAAAGVDLATMIPTQLPSSRGDPKRLESAVVRLLQARLSQAPAGASLTLAARVSPAPDGEALLISVIDPVRDEVGESPAHPAEVQAAVDALGGEILTISDPVAGRVTAIRLPLVAAPD